MIENSLMKDQSKSGELGHHTLDLLITYFQLADTKIILHKLSASLLIIAILKINLGCLKQLFLTICIVQRVKRILFEMKLYSSIKVEIRMEGDILSLSDDKNFSFK